jgi:hypothetical protein
VPNRVPNTRLAKQSSADDAVLRVSSRRGTVRRVWLVSFLAFFLLGVGWALAMPYDGPPDELQHVVRAYGVADGQIYAGGANSPVRTVQSLSLPKGAGCFRWRADRSAACQPGPGANRAAERLPDVFPSGASGYDPSYYFLVGPAIHHWPTMKGILIARFLTAAEISAFLACAVAIAWSTARGRWLLGGLLVGVTPVVVNLMGAVNPAGVEIGAAVAFWVALLDLAGPGRPRRWVAVVAGCSGSVLAVSRGFGVGWLGVTVVVCALSLNRAKIKELWSGPDTAPVRWAAGAVALFSVAGVGWGLAAGANYHLTGTSTARMSTLDLVAQELWMRLPYYVDGTVRLTSYGDVQVPQMVGYLWLLFVGLFLLAGLVVGSLRARIQLGVVLAAGFGMLMSVDMNAVRQGIWFSQGRYALPVLVGAPMIGALALGEAGILDWARNVSLLRWMATLLLPLQFVALWATMIRFQIGFPVRGRLPLSPFGGRWVPVFGTWAPLLAFGCGMAILGAAAWRLSGTPFPERELEPEPEPSELLAQPEFAGSPDRPDSGLVQQARS